MFGWHDWQVAKSHAVSICACVAANRGSQPQPSLLPLPSVRKAWSLNSYVSHHIIGIIGPIAALVICPAKFWLHGVVPWTTRDRKLHSTLQWRDFNWRLVKVVRAIGQLDATSSTNFGKYAADGRQGLKYISMFAVLSLERPPMRTKWSWV
jgi:hypothetical protein